MSRNKADYPQTMEEFMVSEWYPKILTAIRRFHLRESEEDVMQDVLTAMVQKNYLARWEPAKGGAFSNWLYTFVNHMCMSKFNRSHSRGGNRIEMAFSLDREEYPGRRGNDPKTLGETIASRQDFSPDFRLRLEEAEEKLDKEFQASSEFTDPDTGVTFKRDPVTVFRLIVDAGMTPPDIARVLHTSTTHVYAQMGRIRESLVDVL